MSTKAPSKSTSKSAPPPKQVTPPRTRSKAAPRPSQKPAKVAPPRGSSTTPGAPDHFPSHEALLAAQALFLQNFATTGNVSSSAERTGIHRKTAYAWRKTDTAFAEAWAEAELTAVDTIRAEIWRRAMVGWQEPAISAGRLVYEEHLVLDPTTRMPLRDAKGRLVTERGQPVQIRRYDSALLQMLAKVRVPEYAPKTSVELSGPGGGPIELDVRALLLERLTKLAHEQERELRVVEAESVSDDDEPTPTHAQRSRHR